MSDCRVPMPTYSRPEPIGEVVEELKRKVDDLRAEVNEKDMRIYDLEVIIRNMYPAWVGWEQRDDIRREIEDAIQGIVKVIQ